MHEKNYELVKKILEIADRMVISNYAVAISMKMDPTVWSRTLRGYRENTLRRLNSLTLRKMEKFIRDNEKRDTLL